MTATIDIARVDLVKENLTSEEFELFWRNCPCLYKHVLEGVEYYHVYYDFSNIDYTWDAEYWNYRNDTTEFTDEFIRKISGLFTTSWEVWT